MADLDLNKIWLYRIVHIDNLAYLLEHGMHQKDHPNSDKNYINIGDNKLISQRNDYPVPIDPPNGLLGEYVPFYFGPLSPMLYNIHTGYRGITKRPQEQIIYICCSIADIVDNCEAWCFTDGHAKNKITFFYNEISNLNQVDIELAYQRYWSNSEDDFDRMRKKQAEFLVKQHVPPTCISNIVVNNSEVKKKVDILVKQFGRQIKVHVNPKGKYYY